MQRIRVRRLAGRAALAARSAASAAALGLSTAAGLLAAAAALVPAALRGGPQGRRETRGSCEPGVTPAAAVAAPAEQALPR